MKIVPSYTYLVAYLLVVHYGIICGLKLPSFGDFTEPTEGHLLKGTYNLSRVSTLRERHPCILELLTAIDYIPVPDFTPTLWKLEKIAGLDQRLVPCFYKTEMFLIISVEPYYLLP